ncbi:patched family-domain-containing protein [Syncephalis pseudoplumigaleata]|uniref:Patched family-domain-containing protein n=1 Tax=Syncephalis pseudoplumigaleata TaxID=1712513 RepID=A0A4P9Z4U7_9FUNG|nr:patched family-domain-containing protein [Syncephalis pseudoplumigaleata]|eukprot:RKP27617.1 patched family-domain-containing protein [Syncephalis pseudoplumigaleata]
MYGQCGGKSSSIFAPPLNCPTDRHAVQPTSMHRARLVEVCGEAFRDRAACCDIDQLDALQSQIKVAQNVVNACPACWNNMLSFFCEFSCSPDQSTFVNVTATQVSPQTGKHIVTRTDIYVDPAFGRAFYDSCKEVKFPADNLFVMDLIGGGAKNYEEMLAFMGQERLGGSPFQLDFPRQSPARPMRPLAPKAHHCNDTSAASRCSCIDCGAVCPVLEPLPTTPASCHIGRWSCLNVALFIAYVLMVLGVVAGGAAVRRGYFGRDTEGFERVPHEPEEAVQLSTGTGTSDHDSIDEASTMAGWQACSQRFFYRLGVCCASNPAEVILSSLLITGFLSLGWSRFAVDTAPEKLWVSPTSSVARQKAFFDRHFAPFYRTQQIIITSAHDAPNGSVIMEDNLRLLFRLESAIAALSVADPSTDAARNITLADLCLKPTEQGCVVQSVTGYWAGDEEQFSAERWRDDFDSCTHQPSACLPDFGQPIKPDMILGGFDDSDYREAKALFVTYVLRNSLDEAYVARAMRWEQAFVDFMRGLPHNPAFNTSNVIVDFSSEISIEQELNQSSNTDINTVIISYVAMLLYVSLALGRLFRAGSMRRVAVESKFLLGIGGILIVLASIMASVGFFSFMGRRCTLIIAEVIPFLVLAVGVDNVFILVQEFQRQTDDAREARDDASVAERCGRTLARMGPGILLSALAETLAFGLGGFVDMPAVSSFAMYAALAVWLDFMLQVTCFIAFLALDAERTEDDRIDCCPWLRVDAVDDKPDSDGFIEQFFERTYAPFLLQRRVKLSVILAFIALFFACITQIPHLTLGLDQRVALPDDSYLIRYFNHLDAYFRTGPPVYFVVEGGQPTERAGQQQLCGRFSSCHTLSLANVLEQERKRPQVSRIAQPAAIWLDDFFHWLNPLADMCCRVRRSNPDAFCDAWDDEDACEPCFASRDPPWNITLHGMPEDDEFLRYLDHWLNSVPDEQCPLAGAAAYKDAITIDRSSKAVIASHFRTFHTPVRSQTDYIEAYRSAKRIADELSHETGYPVFPYSVFYLFFAQYIDIVPLTVRLLSIAVLAIGLVAWLLLASLSTALIVMACVVMIVVDVIGVMSVWQVSLNAVSLVNLMICIGISVEFCCHLARAFLIESGGRNQRAYRALIDVGSSVFSGITITKLIGIGVLAFSRSKIFVIYYFRVYLAIVVLGALHGLILLPVLLSLIGDGDGGDGDGDDATGTRRQASAADEDFHEPDDDRIVIMNR